MELKDTIELMNSSDYKERMFAEYHQTKVRYEKLKKLCTKLEADEILNPASVEQNVDGTPACILHKQQRIMEEYLHILELRAAMENIQL